MERVDNEPNICPYDRLDSGSGGTVARRAATDGIEKEFSAMVRSMKPVGLEVGL